MAKTLTCTRCGHAKPTTEFYAAKNTASGFHGACRACKKEEARLRRRGVITPRVHNGVSKVCTCCGVEKPLEMFFRDVSFKDGRTSRCKECKQAQTLTWRAQNKAGVTAATQAWRKKNRHRIRGYGLKRRFGITSAQYDAMFEAQRGKCAICGGTDPKGHVGWYGGQKRAEHLHVDHDHETGRVRGLLCADCNKGIGCLQDSVSVLTEAIEYLKRAGASRIH